MRGTRWILVAAIVLVLAVGGPFVYIHFIQGSAPAAFRLSARGTASSDGESVPLDGTWSVGPGSQAGYRVGEVLVGQKSTAVGRTDAVSGDVVIKGTTVESGSFTADVRSLKSEQPSRDRAFHHRIMQTSTYPSVTFELSKAVDFGKPPANGVAKKVQATGKLTMRGTTKPVTIPLTADHTGTTIRVVGSLDVVFADWGIPNPSFAGLVTTEDHGVLEFLLNLKHGAAAPTTTTPPSESEEAPAGPSGGGGPGGGPPPGGMTPPTVTPTTLAPLELGSG